MLRHTTFLSRVGFVALALTVSSCTETAGPDQRAPGAPMFSFSPNGIALDQFNGTLGANGRLLIKGFNPTNPHRGDAIVATFFWLGSTNIIDSVSDVMTMPGFPRVGNTYHLVEYVTAGGISMATYVATNVQGFPDGYNAPAQDSILAVRAHLTDSIVDGGVKISAYSGVEDVFTTALQGHSSGSGAGSAPTTAAPGAIPVSAGGLAYAVTMSNGIVGSDPPANYIELGGPGSDDRIRQDARYLVSSSATTTNPTWTWFFDAQHPGTWLATALSLRAATSGTTTGNLTVTTSTSGSSLDPDGYTVTVDGGSPQVIGINGSVSYAGLTAGSHTVALSGVAANCTVGGGPSQTVNVPSGGTATAAFTVTCTTTSSPGSVSVTTSTTGSSLDPDGYTVTLDGGWPQAIGINGSVSYANVAAGGHTVAIAGVAGNCTVSGGTSRSVTVPSGGTATTSFAVSCATPSGNLTVSTSTTGSGLDPDGYTATVDASGSKAVAINGSVTFTGLAAGTHTVVLSGVAANCTVSGGTSRSVSVPSGGTATVSYAVTCTAPNQPPIVNAGPDQTVLTGLLFTENATFSDPNNDGPWTYRIDWGDGSSTTGTMTGQGTISKGHVYVTLLPRNFTIRVTVTDAHGASGSDTKVITVVLL